MLAESSLPLTLLSCGIRPCLPDIHSRSVTKHIPLIHCSYEVGGGGVVEGHILTVDRDREGMACVVCISAVTRTSQQHCISCLAACRNTNLADWQDAEPSTHCP